MACAFSAVHFGLPDFATDLKSATYKDPSCYTIGILGDLHLDPRDLDDSLLGREQHRRTVTLVDHGNCRLLVARHMKAALDGQPNVFVVSLGDLGESKDCNVTRLQSL